MNRNWISTRVAPLFGQLMLPDIPQMLLMTGLGFSAMSLSAVSLMLPFPTLAQAPTNPQLTPTAIARPTLRLGSQGTAVQELQALLKLLGFYSGTVDGMFQDSTAAAVITFQQAAGLTADGIVGVNTWNRLLPTARPDNAAIEGTATATTPQAAAPAATPRPAASPTVTSTPATSPTVTNPATTNPATTNPATTNPATTNPATTNPATTNSAPDTVSLPILRLGMRGPAVARLQQRLRAIGVFDGDVDGVFGSATQTAVKTAQRRYNLTPDGIVGNATWAALLR